MIAFLFGLGIGGVAGVLWLFAKLLKDCPSVKDAIIKDAQDQKVPDEKLQRLTKSLNESQEIATRWRWL